MWSNSTWLRRRRNRKDNVFIDVSRDEAIVLDAIFRRHRDEHQPLEATDAAETSALIGLGAAIEGSVMEEVLDAERYATRLAEARRKLAENAGCLDASTSGE